MVPQGFDFPLFFLRQLEQAEPLSDPVRGDTVPLPELNTGKVVPEQLSLKLSGVDEWIPVGTSAWFGDVRTEGFQGENGPESGSSHPRSGVPDY